MLDILSKTEPQSEPQLPRRRALRERGDAPGPGRDGRGVGVDGQRRGHVPVLDVEDVEGFAAQLELHPLAELYVLEEREVHVEDGRAAEDVAAEVAEGSRRNAEGAGVDPAHARVPLVGRAPPRRDGSPPAPSAYLRE